MELIVKVCAVGLVVSVMCLLIKKSNPEISSVLSCCCVAVVMLSVLSFAESIKELASLVNSMLDTTDEYVAPVMKCLGISIVTKTASELCKDASQSAVSSAIEFAGIACALGVSMPLIINALKLIGSLT